MGKDSKIEWTHHTFNPWWGCAQVSPACDECYAMTLAQRFGKWWGVDAPRRLFGEKHWREPMNLNASCERRGVRERVFCASMADVFDNHPDVVAPRAELWKLIKKTPHLDWLLLTKRIGNARRMLPDDWADGYPNVWVGITVVTQEEVDRDVHKLLALPARRRFLSMEPLIEPIDFAGRWVDHPEPAMHENVLEALDWVIVGGESGRKARSLRPWWVENIRDQCQAVGTAFFFKQWGEWGRQDDDTMVKVGKLAAGRMLGGRTWDQFPDQPGERQ